MAKKEKHVEDEKKKMEDMEGDMESKEDQGDPEQGHDDADQDKALIKKMLDEYIGQDDKRSSEESEAYEKLAKEAYEAHKEMGAKEDEAYKHAGHALKLAKHMASRQEATDSDDEDKSDKKDMKDMKKDDAKDGGAEEKESKEDECKEESDEKKEAKVKSLEKSLLEARGEIAALKEKLAGDEVEKYVEAKLAKSGRSRQITKAFRETVGQIKSTKDFDTKWKIFCEGAKHSRVELDWSVMTEKATAVDKADDDKSTLNFSSCAD